MALIKCHECGNKISSTVKTCPQCGVKCKVKTSAFTKFMAAILFGGLIIVFNTTKDLPPPTKQPTSAVVQEIKPLTDDEKIKAQFSAWDGSHRILEAYIKKSMNDPDSYEHVETRYKKEENSIVVYTEFRGKNVFNATIKNNMAARFTFDGKFIEMIQ